LRHHYDARVRLALDEQIFAIQEYGGISRLFTELARQYALDPSLGVSLLPLCAPIINRYVLDDPRLRSELQVRQARNEWTALARYFSRVSVKTDCDVVHNTFYLPHGLAPTRGVRRVVTIHDMIPELRPDTRRRLDLLTLKRRYVEKADHVICVSESTRHDLLRVYGSIKAPISVVHHGVDPAFQPGMARLEGLPERYVLFVGNRGQYKDADVLFQAFALLRQAEGVELLCVGGGEFSRAERQRLEGLGISARVHQMQLSDGGMASAYANAEAFVFPSHFEGFGLPALEAMASGTATILASSSSLPEVGGDAALYFDAGNAAALADVLDSVLANNELRRDLAERGVVRASRFTWRATAAQTAAVYARTVD